MNVKKILICLYANELTMEGELEKKISFGITELQIRALVVINKNVNQLYPVVHPEVINLYISNTQEIDKWNNLHPEDRIRHPPEFLESLRGRWTMDLGTKFCPPNLNRDVARQVIAKIIKRAVKEGELNQEIVDNERRYRCSIGSFLVGEDIVEKLGQDHFVLYDKERSFYYPTKEGRTLLATMGGYASLEQSKGVHGLSKEQIILNAGNAGKKGGVTALRNKSGIHALTVQERREIGKLGALAMGMNPWNQETVDYLISLVTNPGYKFPEDHNHRGLPNWQKITEELNSKCETSRSVRAVMLKYRRASCR